MADETQHTEPTAEPVFSPEELALPEGVPPLPASFTDVDRWAWARIVAVGAADFHLRFGTLEESEDRHPLLTTGIQARSSTPAEPILSSDGALLESNDEEPVEPSTRDEAEPGAPIEDELDTVWKHRTLSFEFLSTILCREPWRSALTTQSVEITGARLSPYLERSVEHGLMLDACFLPDGLMFYGATFSRGLVLRSCTLFDSLNLFQAVFGNSIKIDECWARSLDVSDARIDGSLWITDSIFELDADFMGLKVSGSVTLGGTAIHDRIDADRIDVGGTVFARDMPRLPNLDLVNATIGGSLDFSGSRIDGPIDLTNARIGRDLRFYTADKPLPVWTREARLILRNAEAMALQASAQSLAIEPAKKSKVPARKDIVPSDLTGFRFQMFGGRHAARGDTLADAPARFLRDWIESYPGFDDRYTPAPYRAMADVLRSAGYADTASQLLIAKNRHRLRARNTGLFTKLAVWFAGIVSGFGQRNHRALFWYLMMGVAGMFAGLYAGGWNPLALEYVPATWDEWLRASLDNAAPIVEFSPQSAEALTQLLNGRVPGWLETLWYVLAVLGFVVLSYLLAGISGMFDSGEK